MTCRERPRRRTSETAPIWADSPAAVAAECDIIFTSLPGPVEFDAVIYGANGLLSAIRTGAAYFDLTTNSPTTVRKAHAEYEKKGAHPVRRPGQRRAARRGQPASWRSGAAAMPRCSKSGSRCWTRSATRRSYIGPIGAGSVAKLVHNCYGYIATAAAAEVFSMGVKAGIEPLAIWEAVRQGAIGRRGAFDSLTDQFLPNKYEPPAFALRLAHKDVSLATALGRELNVPMRLANLALADLSEGLNRGWGNRDSRAIMVLQTERAGVEIKVDPQRLTEALENKAKNG